MKEELVNPLIRDSNKTGNLEKRNMLASVQLKKINKIKLMVAKSAMLY